jgi:hypothetical protein
VFVCAYLYIEYAELPGVDTEKVDSRTLWMGAAGLAAAWLLATLYFMFRIAVPKYRQTFWSWVSGRQRVHDDFLKGASDEVKFTIYTDNLLLWESEIGEEVKAWTAAGWERWKEESPPWFKVEIVPDTFVPAGELELLGGADRKRRGSAAGSMRESFRET